MGKSDDVFRPEEHLSKQLTSRARCETLVYFAPHLILYKVDERLDEMMRSNRSHATRYNVGRPSVGGNVGGLGWEMTTNSEIDSFNDHFLLQQFQSIMSSTTTTQLSEGNDINLSNGFLSSKNESNSPRNRQVIKSARGIKCQDYWFRSRHNCDLGENLMGKLTKEKLSGFCAESDEIV